MSGNFRAGFAALLAVCTYSSFSPFAAIAKDSYVEIKTLNLKQTFKTKRDWHLTAYQSQDEESKDSPAGTAAKISFWSDKNKKGKDSEVLLSASEFDPSVRYPHQTVSRVETISINPTAKGIWISATFSGGGSGSLTRNELWLYDSKRDEFDKAITFNQTEQGEAKFVSSGPLAGCLVTADAHWGIDESHFEPHYFRMTVRKFNQSSQSYDEILQYLTSKKYDSLDSGSIDVVSPELPQTLAKLKAVYGPKVFPTLKPGSMRD